MTYGVSYNYEVSNEFLIPYLIIMSVISIFMIICIWKINKKAGKPGWASIIPIYNIIVLFEIAQINPIMILLLFVPIANIIVTFKLYIEIAKKFNKSTLFGVMLTLFPVICLPILAFSKCEYKEVEKEEAPASILDVNETGVPNNSEDVEFSYGYEKEATVVMNPVNPENEKNVEEIKEDTNNIENNDQEKDA